MTSNNNLAPFARMISVSALAFAGLLSGTASSATTNVAAVLGRAENPNQATCFQSFGGSNVTDVCEDSVMRYYTIAIPTPAVAGSHTYKLTYISTAGSTLLCKGLYTTATGAVGSTTPMFPPSSSSWSTVTLGTLSLPNNASATIQCGMQPVPGKPVALNFANF